MASGKTERKWSKLFLWLVTKMFSFVRKGDGNELEVAY